jgi:hypothetical protein
MKWVYESYKSGNPAIKQGAMAQEQFEAETLKIVTSFIEAAELINKRNNTTVIFNSVFYL